MNQYQNKRFPIGLQIFLGVLLLGVSLRVVVIKLPSFDLGGTRSYVVDSPRPTAEAQSIWPTDLPTDVPVVPTDSPTVTPKPTRPVVENNQPAPSRTSREPQP